MENIRITPETEVSTTGLACVLGITGRRVRQLSEDGVLEKASKGRFLLCDSVQRYINDKSKETETEENLRLEKARRSADVTLKASKAKIAKMQVDELSGKLHRSEDVAAMTEDLIYTIRGALLSLPGRLAIDVAAVESSAEASEVIRRAVYDVMNELSGYQYDPRKYEERARERMNFESGLGDSSDE